MTRLTVARKSVTFIVSFVMLSNSDKKTVLYFTLLVKKPFLKWLLTEVIKIFKRPHFYFAKTNIPFLRSPASPHYIFSLHLCDISILGGTSLSLNFRPG